MQHNDDSKPKSGAYVKLFNGDNEVTMKHKPFLTDKSKEILRKGTHGQGFIYFVNLDTGEIHLLAANNSAKQTKTSEPDKIEAQEKDPRLLLEEDNRKNLHEREKISLELGKLYDQKVANAGESPELNAAIKKLEDSLNVLEKAHQDIKEKLKAIPAKKISATSSQLNESTIPVDRNGNPYLPGEYAITRREKTSSSGGSGGGDLHAYGEGVLKLRDQNILAGGFWINRQGEELSFSDFRTRSTANTRLVTYNPLYRFLFDVGITKGHEVGHTQVYVREIPKIYLEPVLDVFLQESLDSLKNSGQENSDYLSRHSHIKETLSLNPNAEAEAEAKAKAEAKTKAKAEAEAKAETKVEAKAKAKAEEEVEVKVDTVIPKSTRIHLNLENQWQQSSNELLKNTLNYLTKAEQSEIKSEKKNKKSKKRSRSKEEIRGFVRSFFDDNFVENRQLLPTLLTYVEDNPSTRLSKHIMDCLRDQLYEVVHEALHNSKEMDQTIQRFNSCNEYLMKPSYTSNDTEEQAATYRKIHAEFKQLTGTLRNINSEKLKSLIASYKNFYNLQGDEFCKRGFNIDAVRKARENYEIALMLDPKDKHAKQGLHNVRKLEHEMANSRILSGDGEYQHASSPNIDEGHRNKALTSALKYYSLALSLDPKNVRALNGHGKASCLLKDFDTAIKNHLGALAFEIAETTPIKEQKGLEKYKHLESHKNLVETYNQQGSFYQQKKDFKKAAESYRSALQLDPDNIKAYEGLKKTNHQRGFVQRIGPLSSHKPAKNDKQATHSDVNEHRIQNRK